MKNPLARRGQPKSSERAADGSMTLMEHLRELRSRLFKASLGIVVGLVIGLYFAKDVTTLINAPYCDFQFEQTGNPVCNFNAVSPVDAFMLNLKVALYVGLLGAAPIWLYQLWAFIAPGLHRHEKRYTYLFTAIAVPLFAAGAFLAFFVVSKSLVFFLDMTEGVSITVDLTGYFEFVTGVMLLFGFGFEFPLVLLMLNFVGILSAKKMLGWWRVAVFLMFLFAAIVTPTPDPFGMTALAGAMVLLYFIACGVAALNDRRRARGNPDYAGLDDDDASQISDLDAAPVEAGSSVDLADPVDAIDSVGASRSLDRRYDEMT